jgi:hypothetical protein
MTGKRVRAITFSYQAASPGYAVSSGYILGACDAWRRRCYKQILHHFPVQHLRRGDAVSQGRGAISFQHRVLRLTRTPSLTPTTSRGLHFSPRQSTCTPHDVRLKTSTPVTETLLTLTTESFLFQVNCFPTFTTPLQTPPITG